MKLKVTVYSSIVRKKAFRLLESGNGKARAFVRYEAFPSVSHHEIEILKREGFFVKILRETAHNQNTRTYSMPIG